MVDEEIHDVSAEPAGAPPNRDARRDPGVIEGEIAGAGREESGPPRSAPGGGNAFGDQRRVSAGPQHRRSLGVLSGGVAGLVAAALTVGAYHFLLAPKDDSVESARRLVESQAQRSDSALDAEAKRESAALEGLDKRLSALETGAGASSATDLDKRISALEAAKGEGASNAAAATDIADRLGSDIRTLRADIDAARGEIPALGTRVAKLEAATPKSNDADLAALAARVDGIEAALTAVKNEARAAEKPAPVDNTPGVAIIAGVIAERLASGAPFGNEAAALERLGVDPASLAVLKAAAAGAPTNSALASAFAAVRPRVLAAAAPEEKGGFVDRLLAHMRGVVHVHALGEASGEDADAIVSRIEADCRRGDIAAALAEFDKLPAAAQEAAADWAAKARARQAADTALRSIRDAAIGRLAGGAGQ